MGHHRSQTSKDNEPRGPPVSHISAAKPLLLLVLSQSERAGIRTDSQILAHVGLLWAGLAEQKQYLYPCTHVLKTILYQFNIVSRLVALLPALIVYDATSKLRRSSNTTKLAVRLELTGVGYI